jgi:RNA polymerase-binding transcription factor DksA
MDAADISRLRVAIEVERQRMSDQIDNLQHSFDAIVDAAELTSTDDEHDPEGTTIAYERAQVSALLSRARDDLVALDATLGRLDRGVALNCASCQRPIPQERLLALPGTSNCVDCAV